MFILQLLLVFVGGMTVLLISSQLLLSVAKSLGLRWKLSPLFLALVLVALGTNIPELTFTLTAFAGGDPGLALGNVVGSNVVNIFLVFGVGILIGTPKISKDISPRNAQLMVLMTVLFVVMRLTPIPFPLQGFVLMLSTVLILLYQYQSTKFGGVKLKKHFLTVAKPKKDTKKYAGYPFAFLLVILLASVVGIAMGGYQVIVAIESMAIAFGLSQTILGLTLVAVSTSMPELLTIFVAELKNEDAVVVGTILGSNLYNIGIFAGLLSMTQSRSFLPVSDVFFLVLSAVMMLLLLYKYRGKMIPRYWGVAFIGMFILFVGQALLLPLF